MKLYEIDNEIMNLIDYETGEITDYEAFENLQMEREQKIENIILYFKDLIAEQEAVKNEADKLSARAKVLGNKANNLKAFLLNNLQGEKFKTSKCSVSYRKSEKTVVAEDFMEWAKENATDLVKIETKADLTKIKEAIKSGTEVPYATIEVNQSIIIK